MILLNIFFYERLKNVFYYNRYWRTNLSAIEKTEAKRWLEKHPEEAKFLRREKGRITHWRRLGAPVEDEEKEAELREERPREGETETKAPLWEPRAFIEIEPKEGFMYEKVDGTILASRPVTVFIKDREGERREITESEAKRLNLDYEWKGEQAFEHEVPVVLDATQKCFERIEPPEKCDKVKAVFACADEAGGSLTRMQVAKLVDLGVEDTQKCLLKLEGEDAIRPMGSAHTWAGEQLYRMPIGIRSDVKKELGAEKEEKEEEKEELVEAIEEIES